MLRAIMVYFFFFFCLLRFYYSLLHSSSNDFERAYKNWNIPCFFIRDVTSDYVRIFTYNISQFVVRILNVIEDKNLLLFYSLFSSKKM